MESKNTIKQWAKDDRPREKFILNGPETLSNSELLAILIHNGTPTQSALDLAKAILKLGENDLNHLGRLTLKELMKVKGIGEAKAVTIAAALELGRRRQSGNIVNRSIAANSKEIASYLQERLKDNLAEVFAVVFLNRVNKVLGFEIVSEGGITSTIVDPRIILKKALEKNATAIILSHNHPSGGLKPSRSDEILTQRIKDAAALLEIKVLDHIIVSDSGYFSFSDAGLL